MPKMKKTKHKKSPKGKRKYLQNMTSNEENHMKYFIWEPYLTCKHTNYFVSLSTLMQMNGCMTDKQIYPIFWLINALIAILNVSASNKHSECLRMCVA